MRDAEELKRYIRDVPDFPSPGILFRDITPLLADGPAWQQAVDHVAPRDPVARRRRRSPGSRHAG